MTDLVNSLPPIIYYIFFALYLIIILYTIFKILLDTHSTSKTLAYILLVLILPLAGILFYYSFGINYRHKSSTNKSMQLSKELSKSYKKIIPDNTKELQLKYPDLLGKYKDLIEFIHALGGENLSVNEYKLLLNGEEKFPEGRPEGVEKFRCQAFEP